MAEPAASTTRIGLPYPLPSQLPADVPLYLQRLAEETEKVAIGSYASVADRDAKITNPEPGTFAWIRDVRRLEVHDGQSWKVIYPVPQPTIHTGTGAPAAGLGANGDIYLRYV